MSVDLATLGYGPTFTLNPTIARTEGGRVFLYDTTIEFSVYRFCRSNADFSFLLLSAELDSDEEPPLTETEVEALAHRLSTDLYDRASELAMELYGELV